MSRADPQRAVGLTQGREPAVWRGDDFGLRQDDLDDIEHVHEIAARRAVGRVVVTAVDNEFIVVLRALDETRDKVDLVLALLTEALVLTRDIEEAQRQHRDFFLLLHPPKRLFLADHVG